MWPRPFRLLLLRQRPVVYTCHGALRSWQEIFHLLHGAYWAVPLAECNPFKWMVPCCNYLATVHNARSCWRSCPVSRVLKQPVRRQYASLASVYCCLKRDAKANYASDCKAGLNKALTLGNTVTNILRILIMLVQIDRHESYPLTSQHYHGYLCFL